MDLKMLNDTVLMNKCDCWYCSMIEGKYGVPIPQLLCPEMTSVVISELKDEPCKGGCILKTCHCLFYKLTLGIDLEDEDCHCVLSGGCSSPSDQEISITLKGFTDKIDVRVYEV